MSWPVIQRHLPDGPRDQMPDRIVVHAMGYRIRTDNGVLYAASFLESIGLSAHILVAPDGTRIRCRSDCEGAWHARGYNDDSLGIEVLVDGVHDYGSFTERIQTPWVNKEQLDSAIDQVAEWCVRWDIPPGPGTLDEHSTLDPDRKVDPGDGFPWAEFVRRVKGNMGKFT